MRFKIASISHRVQSRRSRSSAASATKPIVSIVDGTFYRHHPASVPDSLSNPALFSNLTFRLKSFSSPAQHWAIIGPSASGKTTFLQLLRGRYLCFPPTARTFPYLTVEAQSEGKRPREPSHLIKYVGFGGEGESAGQSIRGAYLSARYESLREVDDWSVKNYLQGRTSINADVSQQESIDEGHYERTIRNLKLGELLDMQVANLSNGQTRRTKIARALLGKPELLLLDEPFLGLDPPTLILLSSLLYDLAEANAPRLVLSLRSQDPLPQWITHVIVLSEVRMVLYMGDRKNINPGLLLNASKHHVIPAVDGMQSVRSSEAVDKIISASAARQRAQSCQTLAAGEPVVEIQGAHVVYGSKTVLGSWSQQIDGKPRKGLWWTIRRGERWGVFGPNGSGKTTLLSLICSDHPQTYALPIRLFGRSRLPEPGQPGISIFDLQSRIGHSSPEIHHFIPRSLTLRQTLENAWAETFMSRAKLDDHARQTIDTSLRWFQYAFRRGAESGNDSHEKENSSTSWTDEMPFDSLSCSAQRLALFLRAVIKKPDIVILDEAFSGMDARLRDACISFLEHGTTRRPRDDPAHTDANLGREVDLGRFVITGLEDRQALLSISHVEDEVPGVVSRWICLPEAGTGEPARFGAFEEGSLARGRGGMWDEVWGVARGDGLG